MKARSALAFVGLLAVLLAGCALPTVPGATVEDGKYVFSAQASSVCDKEGDALAKEEAAVAAAVMAKANLLEKIKGIVLSQNVAVSDLMFKSQEAATMVEGFLARATVELVPQQESRLPQPPVVTAKATLTLSSDQLRKLKAYVE